MTRRDLITMTDEYVFRDTLAKAKITDDDKISIIKARKRYMFENGIHRSSPSLPIGQYVDPLTGMLRFNTGR